jgi:transposase InsO family protein
MKNGIKMSASHKGWSWENRPIEMFWDLLRNNCLELIPYEERTYKRVMDEALKFIHYYNFERPQGCLNNFVPKTYKSLIPLLTYNNISCTLNIGV